MLGSEHCRARAALLERQAQGALTPELRIEYLKAAEGWRELGLRAEQLERVGLLAAVEAASAEDDEP